jgi:hypothetical protein
MATSISDCVKMVQEVQSAKEPFVFGIGHVLRYSPYNQAVKAVIDSGALGEIVNIQVSCQRTVHRPCADGPAHRACWKPTLRSFIRQRQLGQGSQHFFLTYDQVLPVGVQRLVKNRAILMISDIDILSFYLSGLKPTKVHSFGSLHLFKPAKKPVEARGATRCYECPLIDECAWSAKKIYVDPLSGTEDKERVSVD